MADYYSLLSRAVSALPHSAPELRRAVYERARKALLNQLRSIQPPVAEADIEAEGRALDEAIARLEFEAARASSAAGSSRPSESPANQAVETSSRRAATSFTPKPAAPRPSAPQSVEPPSQGGAAPHAAAPEPLASEPPPQPKRPAAPLPSLPQPASNSRRMLTIAAVLVVVVGLVALLALQLRERPEDLARLKPEASAPETSESGKIADRVGGEGDQSSSAAEGAPSGPAVAVAQKAELWVSAPDEQNKVNTYPGTVIWRLDSLAAGPGQPLAPAIRADVDIPTAKLKLALVFQKNSDPTLSASHTINVSFQVGSSSDLKGVKAIGPIQMRRPEAQTGEQVAGLPVPITENNFLIGLMRGSRETRNVTLLRAPLVVDLPMQLTDGRAATISLEKGVSGERVFVEALDAWSQK